MPKRNLICFTASYARMNETYTIEIELINYIITSVIAYEIRGARTLKSHRSEKYLQYSLVYMQKIFWTENSYKARFKFSNEIYGL